MKRFLLIAALLAASCPNAMAQSGGKAEMQTFEISPVAPPVPAMKYRLLFDPATELRPGNAALLYMESILLLAPGEIDKAGDALEAYASGNMARFNSMADALNRPALIRELELAGRRKDCDWGAPIRETGAETLLPHLSSIRGLAMIVKVRALRQLNEGKIDDALRTTLIGNEISENVAKEPFVVSGLVSVGVCRLMDDCLRQVMNRPDSPNLYWALLDYSSHKQVMQREMDGERESMLASELNSGKIAPGENLSAGEWREELASVSRALQPGSSDATHPEDFDPVRDAGPDLLREATARYAQVHHLDANAASKIDPVIVLGTFYFEQYNIACDEMFKLRALPYPILLGKSKEYGDYLAKLRQEQPHNVFLGALFKPYKAIWTFASADRELAAMTTVEAISSYAAANNGQFPSRLEDMKDTPAPDNPATGLPFDYTVEGDSVTISDSQSEEPLRYTIKLRH
jgi:hypothetical protein